MPEGQETPIEEPIPVIEGAEPSEPEVQATVELISEGEPEIDESPQPKKAVQKRIDELTRKRHEAERRAAFLEGQLEAAKTKPEPDMKVSVERATAPKPKEEDFKDYEAYNEAVVGWTVNQKIHQWELSKKQIEDKKINAEYEKTFQTNLRLGESRYDDFEEVVRNEGVPFTKDMVEILHGCENPADVAYYLGKNIKVATSISNMSLMNAAKEMGKIEAKLQEEFKTKPPAATKKVTTAPPPVRPTAPGSVISKDPEKMGFEEYCAWRNAGGGR